MLELDDALARLHAGARRVDTQEAVPLARALGRILAQDIISPLDVPNFDNSAMDGYALHVADFANPPQQFRLNGRIAAGATGGPLAPGEAARIFTGAPIPQGANTVVMQEDCEIGTEQVFIKGPVKANSNIRYCGETFRSGQTILQQGEKLTPAMLGLIASVGMATVEVFCPLRVALISTGSELIEPGQALGPGQIYNSNRYQLLALLQQLGCVVTDLGIVPDDLAATKTALANASAQHEVIISTGGVSVGEEDHVKAALQSLGTLDLWTVRIKPGKPFAWGRIGSADFLGLPGNSVSCFVTFLLLARPFLLARAGATQQDLALQAPAAFAWPKPGKRREFLRARLNAAGQVDLFPQQGAAALTSTVWANGLVDVQAGQTIQPGDMIHFLPFGTMAW